MAMKIRLSTLLILTTFFIGVFTAQTVFSAESGTALYIGGSQAFGAGGTPPPGTYGTVGMLYYDGDVRAVIEGGFVEFSASKTAFASVINIMHVLPYGVAGGRIGISESIPFASLVDLKASAVGGVFGDVKTDGWGVGDLSLKLQNGWTLDSFSHTASVTVWVPTGRYDTGFEPNAGKNHTGFDFGWAFTQLWDDPSIELSIAFGYSMELENKATEYRNGDTFHMEPALGYRTESGWIIGAAGYAIEQVRGDKGSGANLGAFKRRAYALGPALSYSGLIGGKVVSISARHYQELATKNTFEGHITFITATMRF